MACKISRGAFVGDINGTLQERGRSLVYESPLFQDDMFPTNDSILTIAVMDALLQAGPIEDGMEYGERLSSLTKESLEPAAFFRLKGKIRLIVTVTSGSVTDMDESRVVWFTDIAEAFYGPASFPLAQEKVDSYFSEALLDVIHRFEEFARRTTKS